MTICLVCNEYPPLPHGGIGTYCQTMARELVRRGERVIVAGSAADGTDSARVDHGVKVVHFSLGSASHSQHTPRIIRAARLLRQRLAFSRRLRDSLDALGVDLVEAPDWSAPLLLHQNRALVVRLHGSHSVSCLAAGVRPSRLMRILERRALNMAARCVAVSRHILHATRRTLALGLPDALVIHNGVDTDLFTPDPLSSSTGASILYVGSVKKLKGMFELFRAFQEVHSSFPHATLTLVGAIDRGDGGSLDEVLLASLPQSARSAVKFLGRQPLSNLPMIYQSHSIAVNTSLAEAFGLTCAEAMACGLPVVMTARGSGPELIEHQRTGLLVEPTDTPALVVAIKSLLQDSCLRQSLGKEARLAAAARFSVKAMADSSLDLYHNLICAAHVLQAGTSIRRAGI